MQSSRGVPEGYDPEGYWFKGWSPFFDPQRGRPGYGLKGRGAHVGFEAARAHALRSRRAESRFATSLRKIADQIDQLVRGMFHPDDPGALHRISLVLEDYTRLITPWATATARRMLAEVMQRDAKGWHTLGKTISLGLHGEIESAAMQQTLRDLLADQIEYITSLPREAAAEVHEISVATVSSGQRWEDLTSWIEERLTKTGGNAKARANLIARTETARASSEIQATRAQGLGSEGFIWRTARDRDVRELHKKFEGKFYRWDDPPILDDERPGLPGTIWNCRCFAEIVLPEEDISSRLGAQPRNPEYLAALRAQGYTTGTAFE